MAWLQSIEHFWQDTEADVLILVGAIKKGVTIFESDLVKAEAWINSNAPTIVSDIEAVLGVVTSLSSAGVGLPASVALSVKAAHDAVAALDAYVAKSKSGGTTVASVLAGYSALKQAAGAHAAAAVAITSAPAAASSKPAAATK